MSPVPCFIKGAQCVPMVACQPGCPVCSRCKENEQAAERAGDKKSTLSRALKGLPERGHMHLKKKYPSGSPPCWPQPALTQPSTDAVQRGPQARQGQASSRPTAERERREGSQRHGLPPGKLSPPQSSVQSWNTGSQGAGHVHGDPWPHPLTLQVETPRPGLGDARQLDLRGQAA